MGVLIVILYLIAFFICMLCCFFALVTYKIHCQHKKYTHIPGPPRVGIKEFYLGQVEQVINRNKRKTFLSKIFYEWHIQYGRIFVIFLLHNPMVITYDQAAIKDILVTGGHPKAKESYENLFNLFGQRFIGIGLVTDTNHERWSKRRLQMNPIFNRGYLKSLIGTFNTTADAFIEQLQKVADGEKTIRLLDYFNRVTLDVIAKVAFHLDIDSIRDQNNPFPKAVFKTFEGVAFLFNDFLNNKLMPWKNQEYKNEVREAIKLLRRTGAEIIEKREKEMERGEKVPEDILTQVCRYKVSDPDFDLEAALDDFVTFFVAGQETTANVMSFLLMECGRNPHVMQKLRDEVDSILGDNDVITYENVMEMEYMGMVLKETLRLYPTAPQTFRDVSGKNCMVAGYHVPEGTEIGVSMYAVHRLPVFHEDPETFDPERFHPDSSRRPSTYTYLPFSIGPRNCIGQTFAQIEAKILTAKFIQKFNINLDMDQSFDIEEMATLKPRDGCRCTLTLRE